MTLTGDAPTRSAYRSDDWALGHLAAGASGCDRSQRFFEAPQIRNLFSDVLCVTQRQIANVGTGVVVLVDKLQQITNVAHWEPKLPAPANEIEPIEVFLTIHAIAGLSAGRVGHDAAFLVIADGLDLDARKCR